MRDTRVRKEMKFLRRSEVALSEQAACDGDGTRRLADALSTTSHKHMTVTKCTRDAHARGGKTSPMHSPLQSISYRYVE